jgi:hypothetical protein
MPQAIPLIIIAAAGAAELVGAALLAAQVAAAASAVAVGALDARKARKRASAAASQGNQLNLQTSAEYHRTIYGRARVGGPLFYAVSEGADNRYLHRLIALAGHEVAAYEKVYYNDDELVLGGALPATAAFSQPTTGGRYMEEGAAVAHIEGFMGTASQAASGPLITASGGQWTSNDRALEVAYLRAQTNYTSRVYTEGLPAASALLRGKKLYDGRIVSTVWSQNAALVIRDFLVTFFNVPPANIDQASFDAAANVCDEWVSYDTATAPDPAQAAAYMTAASAAGLWEFVSGTTWRQRRYTVNGVVSDDADPGDVLEQLVQACAGWLSFTGGVWRLVAGAYTAPTLTLTENDLRGSVTFQPRPPRRELFNSTRGTFVGPLTKYVADDFPGISASAFIAADGGQAMHLDLDLPFTEDALRAQRLSSIYLYRSRNGVLTFPAQLTALALRPGDTVMITLPRFGFSNQVFRVEDWQFNGDDFGIDLVLREESAEEYALLPGASMRDPNPQLNLPNPWNVPAVTGLTATSGVAHATVQNDGTIIQRTRLTWATTGNAFARHLEIETLEAGATSWTPHPLADDSAGSAYLLNLRTGALHDIRARRINTIGARGAWTAITHTPSTVNSAVNLLTNSDWTEDLGLGGALFPDARALRGWGQAGVGAINIGRNYGNGTVWNIGRGGMWFYQAGSTPGDYQFIYQRVPALPGVTYEASVAVNPHRCAAQMYLRWVDGAFNYISDAMGGPDSVDAGAGVVGSSVDISTHPRLWRSGAAPAGTAYIEMICLKSNTTAGQGDSYAFFSKSMLCVAPAGVTKETATPWVDDGLNTVDGQLQSTYKQVIGDASYIVTTANSIGGIVFTSPVTGVVAARINGRFRGWFYGDPIYIGRGRYWMRVAINYVTVFDSARCSLQGLEPAGGGYQYYCSEQSLEHIFAVQAGQVVQVILYGEPDTGLDPGMNVYQIDTKGAVVVAELTRKV